ncbi:MAG TPA: hypothetical protein VH596_10010 [Terriglobales bacterium]|jgi:hypothetical protein
MNNRQRLVTGALVPFLIGLIGMYNVAHHPRFAAIHSVDVVQLVASGMCFGVALFLIITLLRRARTD